MNRTAAFIEALETGHGTKITPSFKEALKSTAG
jgi:hypothetical protein